MPTGAGEEREREREREREKKALLRKDLLNTLAQYLSKLSMVTFPAVFKGASHPKFILFNAVLQPEGSLEKCC